MFLSVSPIRQNVFCLFLVFLTTYLQAQQRIEGRITSAYDQAPIEEVDVRASNSSVATLSDADGYFILMATENAMLTFYYRGTAMDSLPASSNSFMDIHLKMEGKTIPVTYTSSTFSASASAAVIRSDFNHGITAGAEQLIQGRVAGLQMTSASGDPAASTYSIIRGVNSFNSSQPLIVLDGIPTLMGNFSPASYDLGYGVKQDRNPLRFINPSDIQKIEVLKDGSAAMYGMRGGNGVILITTRSAGYKRKQFEYSSQLTLSAVRKRLDLLDRQSFLTKFEALQGNSEYVDYHHNTDWQSEVYHRTVSQKHDISFSNSYKNGQLRASLGYEDQQGIIQRTSIQRLSARVNVQHYFLQERLTLNAKVLFSRVTDAMAPITTSQHNLISSMISTNPTVSALPSESQPNAISPSAWLTYTHDKTFSNVYWSAFSAAYKLTENFKFQLSANVDGADSERENMYRELVSLEENHSSGIAVIQKLDIRNTFVEGNLAYSKKMPKGLLNSVIGISDQRFRNDNSNVAGGGFPLTDFDAMADDLRTSGRLLTAALPSSYYNFGYDNNTFFASSLQPMSVQSYARPTGVPLSTVVGTQSQAVHGIQSLYLRLNYEHQQKYLFAAGLRRDAFNPARNMAGYFPNVTVGWKISQEDFFTNKAIYLKARASFGSAGNANLLTDDTRTRSTFTDLQIPSDGNNLQPPFAVISIAGNPDLRWETTKQFNVGVDFSLANGKLNGTLDIYRKVTHNALVYGSPAQPSAVSNMLMNTNAIIVNKGIEFSLTTPLVQQKKISLTVGTVFSYNANKVTNWKENIRSGPIFGPSQTSTQRVKEDGTLYQYYLPKFNGFDKNGFSVYANGGSYQFQDESPIPHVNGGFTIDAAYKGFYVSTLLTGQFGHYLYNNTANNLLHKPALGNGNNVTVQAASTQESVSNEWSTSTRYLEKGNFVRLQDLTAGYRFVFTKSKLDQLHISASAQNLFVITNYSGFDPEVNAVTESSSNMVYGIDYSSYARARMFTLRMGVTF